MSEKTAALIKSCDRVDAQHSDMVIDSCMWDFAPTIFCNCTSCGKELNEREQGEYCTLTKDMVDGYEKPVCECVCECSRKKHDIHVIRAYRFSLEDSLGIVWNKMHGFYKKAKGENQ